MFATICFYLRILNLPQIALVTIVALVQGRRVPETNGMAEG
jgi:hypothetical protein